MLLLKGHGSTRTVYSVAFAPAGDTLASSGLDGTVRLWDLRTGEEKWRRKGDGYLMRSVAFSPDGKTLAWTDKAAIKLVEIASGAGRSLTLNRWGLHRICFSPDGRWLALTAGLLYLWDLPSGWPEGQPLRIPDTPGPGPYTTGGAAFAPDGRTLAVPLSIRNTGGRLRHEIDLCTLPAKSQPACLTGHTHQVTHLAFAPSGLILAAACGPYLVAWDVASREQVFTHKVGERGPHFQEVAFTPDSRFLAATHNDRKVRVWQTHTWQECAAYDWGIGEVVSLAIAPDGMRAAAGGRSGRIVVWDLDDLPG